MDLKYLFAKLTKKIQFPAIKSTDIDRSAKVCSGSHITNSSIGKYSYIGNFATINHTNVGNFCSVADKVIIGGASHPLHWVSTSPVFHKGKNSLNTNFAEHNYYPYKKTKIGHDVWIGSSAFIKSGVSISNGAIIGMGSVLTKDVGPYEIWGGNPAKLIRKRFDDEIIEKLEKIKWWEWNDKQIFKYAEEMTDPGKFIEVVSNENTTLG